MKVSAATIGAIAAGPQGSLDCRVTSRERKARPVEKKMVPVVITQNRASIEPAIEEALSHLPLESLVRGKRVAVKPNDTTAQPGNTGAVTQPDTLRAVLRAASGSIHAS